MKITKNKIFSKVLIVLLMVIFLGSVFPKKAEAIAGIGDTVFDAANTVASIGHWMKDVAFDAWWVSNDLLEKAWNKLSAKTYHMVLSTAAKKVAYDTAVWLGEGAKGKKPGFLTDEVGKYLGDIANNAAGQYIEEVSKSAFKDFNLCEPDINVKLMMGLGLSEVKLEESKCSFTKMKANWEKEVLQNKDFLSDINNYFEVGGDFGAVLQLQDIKNQKVQLAKESAVVKLLTYGGWKNNTEAISDKTISPPQSDYLVMDKTSEMQVQAWGAATGDAFEDAAQVFGSQYFFTLFNRKLRELGKKDEDPKGGSGGKNDSISGLTKADEEGGANKQSLEQSLMGLLVPNFNTNMNFDVLSKLSMCPDPSSAEPDNCVIDTGFFSAISQNLTVGQALGKGFIRENGKFGFLVEYVDDRYQCFGDEPSFTEAYPYRSMLILRKYRILPVGWELAAQYIHDRPEVTRSCTIGDMVACFDPSDEYTYTSDNCNQEIWCRGLVDPNWVLTSPEHTCKRSGPGPSILSAENAVAANELDSKLMVARNEYCADEQSCIYENEDGACEQYGYCVEEKRKWDFGTDSCDPNFNSCETFRDSSGKSLSLLENTIDNSVCTADNVGCTSYCEDYNVDTTFSCTSTSGNKVYLDKDAQTCDAGNEGCHQFIRTKVGLGTNLIQNSGFEDNLVGDVTSFGAGATTHLGNPDIGWMAYRAGGSTLSASIVDGATGQVHSGTKSALISTNTWDGIGSYDSRTPSYSNFPDGFDMKPNATYTVSAWVFVQSGSVMLGAGSAIRYETATSSYLNTWEQISVSFINDGSIDADQFFIYGTVPGAQFYVDDIQFEESLSTSNYKGYGDVNVVYEKLLPDYLADSCYRNPGTDYGYKDDYPAVCDKFARLCNEDEVGCDMYSSVNSGISIPAKVDVMDYCTAECVGYDQYMQHDTIFSSLEPKYFIPANSGACDAGSVACEEFTNLDAVASGGETKEYYSYLRQCVKPGEVGSNCNEFYTWEGSSETGFQLKVHSLQTDNDADDGAYPNPEARYDDDPAVTSYDYDDCNELIYKMNLNSDCREFYNKAGEISYHSYSLTVTCSNDCHPFRLTKNNVVKDPVTGANISWPTCQSLSIYSDRHDIITNTEFLDRGECVLCKSGGTWDSASDSCLYKAIPSEGTVCSAAVSGCREYSGNNGNTIYNVFTTDFEGSTQGWLGVGATTVITDNDSLRVNEEALRVQVAPYTIAREVGTQVQEGKSYYLEFLAKGISAGSFTSIHLTNGTEIANFRTDPSLSISLGTDYTLYKLNLASLDHSVALAESMVIQADGSFMIDDIKLVEITDRYYLIENSWQIPDSCYEDIYGNPVGQLANLGCDEYTDRAEDVFYIHNFPVLCQESAVGCEELIDTHNNSDFNAMTFNAGDLSEEIVPADNIIYAVYDEKKECYEDQKGCQILGKPYNYENTSVYRATYLVNDSDDYGTILCYDNEVGCKSWTNREGNVYFKDPGNETCEYRIESDSGKTGGACLSTLDCDPGYSCESGTCMQKVRNWNWFKTAVKRCDADFNGTVSETDEICLDNSDCNLTGRTCSTNADCGNTFDVCLSGVCRNSCIDDKADYECALTTYSTIGTGGKGAQVKTPTVDGGNNNWAGICPSSEESCSEYIDPVSDFSVNLLANSSFGEPPAVTYSANWQCSVSGANCTLASDCSVAAGVCVDNIWKASGSTYTQTVKLERNYIYRLASINDNAGSNITISCPSLTEYSEANNALGGVGTTMTVSNPIAGQMNSEMFYIAESGIGDMKCTVVMNNVNLSGSDYAEVKRVVVNYQLEIGLDKKTCNGIVNRNEGCVLFNEREVRSKNLANIVYSSLDYDADNTVYGSGPRTCTGPSCNSNQIIKVTPDRMCDKWLACTEMIKAGGSEDNVCASIGICDKLDKNGNCERFVAQLQQNYVYNPAISGIMTAGDIYNMSGYVKVGYLGTMVNQDTTRKSDDKFNFGSMQPHGSQAQILNGSFEFATENSDIDNAGDPTTGIKPTPDWGDNDMADGWNCGDTSNYRCEVIDDPIENEKEKICYVYDHEGNCQLYAPDGRNFYKLSADNEGVAFATSSEFSVTPNTNYALSFFVNTMNLNNGRARLHMSEFQESGVQNEIWTRDIDYQLDWRKEVSLITSSPTARSMRLELTIVDLPQGSVYFDEIEMKETLRVRAGNPATPTEDIYETKDCRLYPKNDALSCNYYENGIRYKGWTGYCLEYDRYPGWTNACLQWWSIPSSLDSVNSWCGDGAVGDDEDCECAPAGNVEVRNCDSESSIPGTSVDNSYRCINCMWQGGWCGDNYVDTTNPYPAEECDWNESRLSSPRGSEPNNDLGGSPAAVDITCENLSFYKGAAYPRTMFTDGNLGCFSHDGGYNVGVDNNDRCTYDTDYGVGSYLVADPAQDSVSFGTKYNGFGCTRDLNDADPSDTYNPKTSEDCILAGGVVVSETIDQAAVPPAIRGGAMVIDSSRNTVLGNSNFGNTFCKFTININNDTLACQAIGGVVAVLPPPSVPSPDPEDYYTFCRVTPASPITVVTIQNCYNLSGLPPVALNASATEAEGLVCNVGGVYTEIPVIDQNSTVGNLCGNFGDGTWRAYMPNGTPWSLTSPCTASISCAGPPCGGSLSLTSSSHNIFQELGIETVTAHRAHCRLRWNGCHSSSKTCYATIDAIGCY